MAGNEDLTFKINSQGMEDTIDDLTKKSSQITEMGEIAKDIVEKKLAEHGVPGDISQIIVDAYERDVVSRAEKNTAANDAYIAKSTSVNEEFVETQQRNNSLFN